MTACFCPVLKSFLVDLQQRCNAMSAVEVSLASGKRARGRRWWWGAAATVFIPLAIVARPAWHLWRTTRLDVDYLEKLPAGYIDDASRMNLTAVHEVRRVPANPIEAERQLAAWLREASDNGWKVSIAGARHSMGGHSILPGGLVIDMCPLKGMEFHHETNSLHVGAGALWSDVLAYLDKAGRSVGVMQSNNSFTVGGSLSVNCHGWQVGKPPISSTVRGFRIMLADGSVLRCSREENHELFSAALGGYGLFGIILDADLAIVPNQRYRIERRVVSSSGLPAAWDEAVAGQADVEMVYGRLNVTVDEFLHDAILYAMYVDGGDDSPLPPIHAPGSVKLRREIFRGAAADEYGKRLRWQAELKWQPKLANNSVTRNQLFNEGVEVFQNRSRDTTDILHEYFVPRAQYGEFVARLQEIVPRHAGNLMNVTVRSVETDTDTMLRYATEPVFSFVMLFQQERSREGDAKMVSITRDLIDAVLELGGRYYLPYRLHATPNQFLRGYSRAGEFFALKRKYDPDDLFQNQFYLTYGVVGQDAANGMKTE
jgi:FAD/FMN-containing dehydrogenase